LSYEEVLDEERNQILAAVHVHVEEQNLRKPFSLVEDKEVTQEDKDFICRTMQLDPSDRLIADELLADRWFDLP
jgi:casein kinase II subunit alpha